MELLREGYAMFAKAGKMINNMPLRHKISGIIVLINLLFVGIISLLGLGIVTSANNTTLYNTMVSSLGYAAAELRNNLRTAERISAALITDSTVQELLIALKGSPDDLMVRSAVFRQLSNQLQTYQTQFPSGDVGFITMTAENMTASTNTARMWKVSETVLSELALQARKADGRVVWRIDQQTLLLCRLVRRTSPFTLESLGLVTIGFNLDAIINRCTNFKNNFSAAYYMLVQDDHVVYAPRDMDEMLVQNALESNREGYAIVKWNGHRYFALRGAVGEQPWEYVSLVSYDEIYAATRVSIKLYTGVLLIGLAVSICLCNLLMRRLTRHIDNLILKMQTFGQNNAQRVDVHWDYTQRNDELGVLHRRFDRMADQIEQLIQTDYTNKLLMKDAQIKMLETQIDPHFLYNVLASISWRAKAIGAASIARVTEALSKLLRASLSDATETFTLRKEMELVSNYATIQEIRFEDHLDIMLDIPEALMGAQLPKLTVQPLVENAIRYAMQENTEVCHIAVSAHLEEDRLYLEVTNTGSQFEDDFLQKLQHDRISIQGFGIGILNIQKRLQLTFGEQYGLRFSNRDGRAAVTMAIPYRLVEE